MEYWVTIAIPTSDKALAESIFDALAQKHPEARAVMDVELAAGRTSFVLCVDAEDPLVASSAGVAACGGALEHSAPIAPRRPTSSTCTWKSRPMTSFRALS